MPHPAGAARTIQEVIDRLDAHIHAAVRDGSRTAYFACLYRAVTARVRDGITAGRFQDGPRIHVAWLLLCSRRSSQPHHDPKKQDTRSSDCHALS